ncbi:Type II secretion system protein G precursor [Planctomycetes bacterium Pan216]|uniref:Type II secretion system protein G n=1 Tax=Kolteria novifilia TaxID=2527975 RepID=A0A518BCW1_9BACT|nr:Type II secretion system protein G precursor [Planctomycetes bacterium Pan216]
MGEPTRYTHASNAPEEQNIVIRNKPSMVGFTLVELLVVIAIIGVLVSLLLPAVQQARESARRSMCTNNLKQLATSLHNYHDAHSVFPYGRRGGATLDRETWFHRLLPYMDQTAIFDKYEEQNETYCWHTSDDVISTVVPMLSCPSDPSSPGFGGASTRMGFQGNYVGLNGNGIITHGSSAKGMFWSYSSVSLGNVLDGTSKTILASEVIVRGTQPVSGAWGAGGGYWGGSSGGSYAFTTLEPPNPLIPDVLYGCKDENLASAPCRSTGSYTNPEIYARSLHPGGVNAALVDGTVIFVGNSIDADLFRALGTRAGGEITEL